MNLVERVASAALRASRLGGEGRAVTKLRGVYEAALRVALARNGLSRSFAGEPALRIKTECRSLSENYEPEVIAWLRSNLTEGFTVFDIGANVGVYTMLCARLVGETGKVVAFEPSRAAVEFLVQHLAMNRLESNVEIVEAAVGEHHGFVELSIAGASGLNRRLQPGETAHDRASVEATTIDTWAERHGSWPDVVKIDVEGMELDVLRGASTAMMQQRPIFVIEMHPHLWHDVDETLAELQAIVAAHGYVVRALDHGGEPLGTEGHVVLEPAGESRPTRITR